MQAPIEASQRGVGEVFSLDILSHRMSVIASPEKSRNSLQTGGWHETSFHASLWPDSGHADLISSVEGVAVLLGKTSEECRPSLHTVLSCKDRVPLIHNGCESVATRHANCKTVAEF